MFTRISRFFKSIIHAILGMAEGRAPVALLEQSVNEMIVNLRSLRDATAQQVSFETRAKNTLEEQKARDKKLQGQAEDAMKQGNEKLARRALQLQVEAKTTLERATQAYAIAKTRAANARVKLQEAQARIEPKIRQLGELKSIAAMNEAQKQMQTMTDNYNIDGASTVFDKVAGTLQEQSDKLAAMDTIAVSEGQKLDSELAKLGTDAGVEQALAELKARIGQTPASNQGISEKTPENKEKISSAFD